MNLVDEIDNLVSDGWLVVLKRMPPGRGWIVEGSRSEYDAPCDDRTIGLNLWLCELSDMNWDGHEWRMHVDGLGKTAEEAVRKARENAERRTK